MNLAENLKSNLAIKAVKNVQRGFTREEVEGTMFRPEITLDLQRSRLMTEAFQMTDGLPMVLRRAKALAHVLNHMKISIMDWERIVGFQTEERQSLYHPIDLNWKSVKRLVNSPIGKNLLDDAGREEFEEICRYWQGKSMHDRVNELFSGDLLSYSSYDGTFLWLDASELGIPDYETLFQTGLRGRIQMARERLEEIDRTVPGEYVEQKEFLQAVIIVLEAVINYAGRYAALAKEMAAGQADEKDKNRLEEIARTCERVPENPPETLLEAFQFFYFIHLVRYLEFPTMGIGVRFDKVFGPYYEKDLQENRMTRSEAIELIQLLWAKFLELGMVYSPFMSSVYGGVASLQAITLGGVDEDGGDITNEFTYIVLEAAKMMRTIEPSIALRIHDNTPDELFSAAVEVIKTGIGYPSFLNDEAIVPLLEQLGATPRESLDYGISGCVYLELPGKNITRRAVCYFVLPKCLWWAFHQGIHPETGEQRGAKTPHPATFESWEDVLDAYLDQVKFFGSKVMQIENTCRNIYAKYCPRPLYSSIVQGCIETGRECKQWVHDSSVSELFGPLGQTNVADSFAAIQKVVFEEKRITLPELIELMDRNWEGGEEIRQACLNAPKFGNDDDYADSIAQKVHYRTEEVVRTLTDRFGHPIKSDGSGSVTATYGLAKDTPATPDGRRDGQPFADSTIAPQPGMDKKGPTAVLNSAAKIDTLKTYNHLLNQKFSPQILAGDMKPVFINYLKTWRDKKISHIQFNVVDRETLLEAQENPEEHRELIVRVAGFSAYFADLSRGLQDHIIARTEQSFY